MEPAIARLHPSDRAFVREAVRVLERPGRLIEILNAVTGRPVEALMKRLPERAAQTLNRALYRALNRAVAWAAATLERPEPASARPELDTPFSHARASALAHTTAAAVLGGVSGAFGIGLIALELPVTTTVMLRSIASIARDMGADLSDAKTRLECVSVFSFGGPSPDDDATDSSYLTTRLGLAMLLRDAGSFIAGRSAQQVTDALARGSAPELADLIARIGGRFGYAATDIASAQLVPVVGAVGGAAINACFANYFNRIALYHFGIRKLERLYGEQVVEAAYREELEQLPRP